MFNGHNSLIQGFNTFLPQGYRIECSSDPSDPNPIRVTTPRGTTSRPDGEPTIPYPDGRWQQQPQAQQHPSEQYSGYPGPMHPSGEVAVNGDNGMGSMSQLHAAANGNRSLVPAESRRPGDPVEFNHAISYVNKIKTRFVSQPDIYKTFLEILQTYQREQLRIAEVYAQVTHLFREAPDLLDDFKEFLPDMTQPRQPEMVHSENVRLPPFGKFDPPTSLGNPPNIQNALPVPKTLQAQGGRKKKSQDISQEAPTSNLRGGPRKKKDALVSPSLVPATPEPLLPEKPGALLEEISFFDKAKKHISNKQTYNEFLKVLNLFSQRIIDKDILVDRVEGFLSGNKELITWFKGFVKYEGKPLQIENIPNKKHLLELNLCRSYGRSYRELPKSETYMPCSGRDEMCWEVLNDEWVGHPTWASEEAGFVAHRKNQYEEIMHRVEEERLEYDHYVEINLLTIQSMETIASRIANMTAEEKALFKLPPTIGHSSTIYKKVLKKIYGDGRYHEVVDALRESPAVSVPIVLRRLKLKDEEWKRAHREWNKVWRDTEQKVFFKSLDHRGLTFKQTDKKYLTSRQLVSEIMTVKTEQNNKRLNPMTPKPKEQLVYKVKNRAVLMDVLRLVMCYLEHANSYSSNDRERMEGFFKTFLTLFFSLPEDLIQTAAPEKAAEGDNEAEAEAEESGGAEKRPRDSQSLLRDVLKKSKHARIGKSREDNLESDDTLEEIEKSGEQWLKHINANASAFEERPRHTYNLFANTTVYVFIRLLNILYERLEEVKGYEEKVSKEIGNNRKVQFALDLDLYDHRMEDMNLAFKSEDCYGQLLNLIENLIEGDLEHQLYEEAIRQAYRNRAYKLYTVDKVVQAIVKHLHNIVSDAKSSDALLLFEQDREKPCSSAKEQILYRMKVKSVLGADENIFRIEWNNNEHQVLIQFLGHDALTLSQTRTDAEKWNYYLTSYLMSTPTEGVPLDKVQVPFLQRTLTEEVENPDFLGAIDQGLAARICPSTYKLFFDPNSEDFLSRRTGAVADQGSPLAKEQQQSRWHEFLESEQGNGGSWKADLDEKATLEAQGKFDAWKRDGPDAMAAWKLPAVAAEVAEEEEEEGPVVVVSPEIVAPAPVSVPVSAMETGPATATTSAQVLESTVMSTNVSSESGHGQPTEDTQPAIGPATHTAVTGTQVDTVMTDADANADSGAGATVGGGVLLKKEDSAEDTKKECLDPEATSNSKPTTHSQPKTAESTVTDPAANVSANISGGAGVGVGAENRDGPTVASEPKDKPVNGAEIVDTEMSG